MFFSVLEWFVKISVNGDFAATANSFWFSFRGLVFPKRTLSSSSHCFRNRRCIGTSISRRTFVVSGEAEARFLPDLSATRTRFSFLLLLQLLLDFSRQPVYTACMSCGKLSLESIPWETSWTSLLMCFCASTLLADIMPAKKQQSERLALRVIN